MTMKHGRSHAINCSVLKSANAKLFQLHKLSFPENPTHSTTSSPRGTSLNFLYSSTCKGTSSTQHQAKHDSGLHREATQTFSLHHTIQSKPFQLHPTRHKNHMARCTFTFEILTLGSDVHLADLNTPLTSLQRIKCVC